MCGFNGDDSHIAVPVEYTLLATIIMKRVSVCTLQLKSIAQKDYKTENIQ